MNNTAFKKLLLQIASLTTRDQQWLLQQCTPEQRQQFSEHKGFELLKNARRFQCLSGHVIPQSSTPALPAICQSLAKEHPLFVAIVLEQGQFDWQRDFLADSAQAETIKTLLHEQTPGIKAASKALLLKEWQERQEFSDYLENAHG